MDGEKKGKWQQNLADLFELPREIMLNLPKLTVIGNLQCYIENHRGVIEYTEEKIRVSVNGGEIVVRGEKLIIRYLINDEIAIDGDIKAVSYEF